MPIACTRTYDYEYISHHPSSLTTLTSSQIAGQNMSFNSTLNS